VSSVFMVLYVCINNFLLTSFSLPFSELNLVGLALDVVEMGCWSGGRGISKKTVSVLQYCVLF